MVTELVETFTRARNIGTPLIAINTPDAAATARNISQGVSWVGEPITDKGKPADVPIVQWDTIRGVRPYNAVGAAIIPEGTDGTEFSGRQGFVDFMSELDKLSAEFVLFVIHAHRFVTDEAGAAQALWNARDRMKSRSQTVVLLGPDIDLPVELEGSVMVLNEPLPDRDALSEIVTEAVKTGGVAEPSSEEVERVIDDLIGLAHFPAESSMYMALARSGINHERLRERKRAVVEQTKGLSVNTAPETFGDIAGYDNIKDYLGRIFAGEYAPRCIVFMDEIEKGLGGIAGDNTGVSQDFLGQLLSFMEDQKAVGLMFVGHAGTGKSQVAKAAGNEFGVPTFNLDIGGLKEGLVGSSETNVRRALAVIATVSAGAPMFIATSNNLGILPPALRRRFKMGTWMFDTPSADDKKGIWNIWLEKFGLKTSTPKTPDDTSWTGSDIQTCCQLAATTGVSLVEAVDYFVPVAQANPEEVNRLRSEAHGRYIDAARKGRYLAPTGTREDVGLPRQVNIRE